MMRSCSILIPTYNGRDILDECLPSLVEHVETRGAGDEIIVLDNASTDDTCRFLEDNFPGVRILPLSENKAIFALNDGARAAKNPYLFFLNNDMLLKPGCIDALLRPFEEESIFAVTGKVYQWDQTTVQAGRRFPAVGKGYFWYLEAETDEPGLTLHALGGQSIFDRQKFLDREGSTPFFPLFIMRILTCPGER